MCLKLYISCMTRICTCCIPFKCPSADAPLLAITNQLILSVKDLSECPLQHSGCLLVGHLINCLYISRVLPKSARWLMANDRQEEAWELIQKAAQMNGKPLTKQLEICQVEMQLFLFLTVP